MATTARALGIGPLIEYEGKQYRLSPWTFGIQGEFEVYLEDCERRGARKWREGLTADEYVSLLAKVNTEIETGKYAFGGEAFRAAAMTTRHFPYLLWLCLRVEDPSVTLDLARAMVAKDLPGLLDAMAQANNDPNRKGSGSVPEPSV